MPTVDDNISLRTRTGERQAGRTLTFFSSSSIALATTKTNTHPCSASLSPRIPPHRPLARSLDSLQSATAPPYSSNFILAAALLLQNTGSLGFRAIAWVKREMARW